MDSCRASATAQRKSGGSLLSRSAGDSHASVSRPAHRGGAAKYRSVHRHATLGHAAVRPQMTAIRVWMSAALIALVAVGVPRSTSAGPVRTGAAKSTGAAARILRVSPQAADLRD